jgi:hypothetical protein
MSLVCLYSLVFILVVYLLIEFILFRPSSLGLSLEVLILYKKYSSCSLVGRISNSTLHSLALFYVALPSLFQVSNSCVVLSVPKTPDWTLFGITEQSTTQPDKVRLSRTLSDWESLCYIL